MKNITVTAVKIITLSLLLSVGVSCKANNCTTEFLKRVLSNLEQIKSATYTSIKEAWQQGDTIATRISCYFVREYNNPADTTIGASVIHFDCECSTKFLWGYDGNIAVSVSEGIISVNDFTTRALPFRPVSPPFFNYTTSIIRYVLTTQDNISVDLQEFDDYYFFRLVINEDRQIEFFGRAYRMAENPFIFGETTSIYELWICKSNYLPYRVRREMFHSISVEAVSNVELNTLSIADFDIRNYFPVDYEINIRGENRLPRNESALIGQKAPSWTLYDKNGRSVPLSKLKGKVSLIQFTGIGCTPCTASIPLMNELREKFSEDDFGLVAIETWVRRQEALQNYARRHRINYILLSGTDEIAKKYGVGLAAPIFFILDRDQIVRKVISGYNRERTRTEIIETLNELF